MTVILDKISALEYWRTFDDKIPNPSVCFEAPCKNASVGRDDTGSLLTQLNASGLDFLSEPVHLLVPDSNARIRNTRIMCQILPRHLPQNSFVRICDDIFAIRPELCLFHLANKLSHIQLAMIGLELCGNYRLAVGKSPVDYNKSPLIRRADLKRFTDMAGKACGVPKVRCALPYITDRSASPMETILYLLLILPQRLGGYGLPMPNFNSELQTSDRVRKATGKRTFRCDMLWHKAHLAVEYDSNLCHTGPDRISDDATRRAALADLGIEVVTVTNRQLRNQAEFDVVVHLLTKRLGKRTRSTKLDWTSKRNELRAALLYRD